MTSEIRTPFFHCFRKLFSFLAKKYDLKKKHCYVMLVSLPSTHVPLTFLAIVNTFLVYHFDMENGVLLGLCP